MIRGKGLSIIAFLFCVLLINRPLSAAEEENNPPQLENSHHEDGPSSKGEIDEDHAEQTVHHADNEYNKGATHIKKFDPGKFMFDHIGDSYGWHILGHLSLPLPVILYSKESGFHVFSSAKFEHGHSAYKGFHIGQEGESIIKINARGDEKTVDVKGKIIETHSNGKKSLPFDVSITKNILSLFVGITILLFIFLSMAKAYKNKPGQAPKGLQSALEPFIIFVRDEIAKPSIGEKKFERFLPFLLTVFFFIWINNMLGLVPFFPGGANLTGNISVTLVLAFFTFIITTINGNKSYWQHIFNTPGVPVWLKLPPLPVMPIVETIGIFTKPFILMVRLFANITAGHIIAMGFISLIFLFGQMGPIQGYGISLVSVGFVIFMTFLELLVAFIQAYVFTFLSAIYFGMAVEEHH